MTGPSNRDEATNAEPVPQAARPVGSGAEPAWRAVSATGDAEYGEPVAERAAADRAFATSADSPLESDVTQHIPSLTPGRADDEQPANPSDTGAEPDPGAGVPDADPDQDLAAGPPDGR